MSSSHEAAETEDADESDHHLCLRCRRSIQGLENYVRHRRNKNCSGKTKKVQQESEFVGSLRLQHKRGVTNEEEEEEEEAVAAAAAAAVEAARSFRDDQVASSFEHQEGPEPVEVEGGTSYEDGGEGGGGAHRIRRPSSDQAMLAGVSTLEIFIVAMILRSWRSSEKVSACQKSRLRYIPLCSTCRNDSRMAEASRELCGLRSRKDAMLSCPAN